MRLVFALPLLLVAGCNVQRDDANDSTTVSFNEQRLENAVEDVGNAAEGAADAIGNEVRDLDVDVDTDADVDANATVNTN